MTPADLAATHAAAFVTTRPWSKTEFSDLLAGQGVILLGDAKSFLLARVIGDEAEVLTLATHPDYQRQGLAQAVLHSFQTQTRCLGVATVFLEVADNNHAAKALYLKEGFTLAGHRPRYYDLSDGSKVGADVLRLTF
jgi:ribosomal-protein-alanine N-acetyltransferase